MADLKRRVVRAGTAMLLDAALPGRALRFPDPAGPARRTIVHEALAIVLRAVPTIPATLAPVRWCRAGDAKAGRLPDRSFSRRIEAVARSSPPMTIPLPGGLA